jgi:hypothetical protein
MKKLLVLAASSFLFANAGMAATTDMVSTHRMDRYQAGTHQFYAWCSDHDRVLIQPGASAAQAGATLALLPQAAGCRLHWQGRINS